MSSRMITVIGSLNTDLVTVTPRVPSGGETLTGSSFHSGPGGKGANQAVACVRLSRSSATPNESDITVNMIGAVGDDDFGRALIAGLKRDAIDTSRIKVAKQQSTGVAVIIVEEATGENRIILSPGANHTLHPHDFDHFEDLRGHLIILQLELSLDTVLSVIRNSKLSGACVLLNPAPAVELPDWVFEGLDHLILNESEAELLSGHKAAEFDMNDMHWGTVTDEFLRKGVRNVVVTLGGKGAYFSSRIGGGEMVTAVTGVKVVDTTAAGDTFVGAYAVHVVRGRSQDWHPSAAVRWACKAASKTVSKRGAQSSIPWADEIDGTDH